MESELHARLDSIIRPTKPILIRPMGLWDLFYTFNDLEDDLKDQVIDRLIQISRAALQNPYLMLIESAAIQPDNTIHYIIDKLFELLVKNAGSDI